MLNSVMYAAPLFVLLVDALVAASFSFCSRGCFLKTGDSFRWQAVMAAKTDKLHAKSEKIKEGLEQKKEAFTDLSNKKAGEINEKLVRTPFPRLAFPNFPLFAVLSTGCVIGQRRGKARGGDRKAIGKGQGDEQSCI